MNSSPVSSRAAGARASRAPRPHSSIEDELAVITEELAAARELFSTCDPDSPPWAVEAEIRRLELRRQVLVSTVSPVPSPTGDTSARQTRLHSAA